MGMSDVSLLNRWRTGEQEAAKLLFERYFDLLYRFFATKTDTGIEDLVQETLLACVRGRDRIRDDAAFRPLVFGIARRLLYKRWRDGQRGANAIDFGLSSVTDLGPSPSGIAAEREINSELVSALRRIPVDLQIALELFYWENLSSAQIAVVLEVPAGTVRSRLRRGRELLRRQLAMLKRQPPSGMRSPEPAGA